MPGARYDGDMIIQLRGNKDLARQYVGEARKVMGFVLQDAEVNNLGVHSIKRYAHDGTEIVAEKIGDLKRVRITPPGGPGRNKQPRLFEDLVLGYNYTPDGGSTVDTPPVILQKDEEDGWKSFFYNDEALGYYDGAGTYSSVFPFGDDFDNRKYLRDATVQWTNGEGLYCAWIAASPYYGLPGRHPDGMYTISVLSLGRVLLNLVTYEFAEGSRSNSRVLAACIRDNKLYVVLSPLGPLFYTARPPAPSTPYETWASNVFSSTPYTYTMLRIDLREELDQVSGQMYLKAVPLTDVVVWEETLERAYGAWRFSRDGMRCVTIQLPSNTILHYHNGELTNSLPVDTDVIEVLIDPEEGLGSTNRYASGSLIYDDGDAQLHLEHVGGADYDYVCGATRFPAVRSTETQISVRRISAAFPSEDRYLVHDMVRGPYYGDPPAADYLTIGFYLKTYRDIAIEKGVETIAYERSEEMEVAAYWLPNSAPLLQTPHITKKENVFFSYLGSEGLQGQAAFYAGSVGCVYNVFMEYDDRFWYRDFAVDRRTTYISPFNVTKSGALNAGVSNGGMAGVTMVREPIYDGAIIIDWDVRPPETWDEEWSGSDFRGYGLNESILPEYVLSSNVRVAVLNVATPNYLFGVADRSMYLHVYEDETEFDSDRKISYLTDGDLSDLLGVGIDDVSLLSSYVLGKPLKSQPYSIPVRTP